MSLVSAVARLIALAEEKFVERQHPRGPDGEFIKKGASKGAPKKESQSAPSSEKPSNGEADNVRYLTRDDIMERKPEQKSARAHLVHEPDRNKWPEHIKALKLPPAWTDVHVSPDPKADLQAIGRDQKGRPQYVYSKKFQETQAAVKFQRIHELDGKFEDIYQQNAKMRKSPSPKVKDHSDCMHLIMTMGLRPGGDADTGADKKAFGATNLQARHVVVKRGKVHLQFTGKKGVDLDLPVHDKYAARMLLDRSKKAEHDEAPLFPTVSASSLLDHVHNLGDGGYKTKDFRTLLGTRLGYERVRALGVPKNAKEYKKMVRDVAVHVSTHLGNTPTVALQSYISPVIFAEWQHAR